MEIEKTTESQKAEEFASETASAVHPFLPGTLRCKGEISQSLPKHDIGSEPRTCDTCLSWLNAVRWAVIPMDKASTESNQNGAITNINHMLKIHEMSFEQVHLVMKRMEAATAEIATIYHTMKIKARIPDPTKEKKDKEFFVKGAKQQILDNAPKKEKKILTHREKAIEALVKSSKISYELASSIIDSQMAKMGAVSGLEPLQDSINNPQEEIKNA